MWESGLRHLLQGDTSVEELLRVASAPSDDGSIARAAAVTAAEASTGGRHTPTATAPPGHTHSGPAAAVDLSAAFDLLDEKPAAAASKACVLLVDDEDQLRKVMRDLLEREGYLVAEARDGIQALSEVDRHAPDIIVLDLNLPGMDGYSVLTQLRSRPSTRSIPIIVLTAKGDEDNEVRVFELGADDFLTKPFRARALSARLEAVLSRRRA